MYKHSLGTTLYRLQLNINILYQFQLKIKIRKDLLYF